MMSKFRWGNRSLGYLDDERMHPLVRSFMNDVLDESTVDASVIDGARDKSDQAAMFKAKRSELDGVAGLSDHQVEKYEDGLARAIDVIPVMPKGLNVWLVEGSEVAAIWAELFRAILRVDRLWKSRGIDVGLELGWTYDIGGGRDYPHCSFKQMGL